ncbi:MAG: hypothetical protein AB4080_06280, partial [Trichodesmium sp.]
MNLYLGLDFGTSGARGVVIDSNFEVKAQTQYTWQNAQLNKLPDVWQNALFSLISDILEKTDIALRIKVRTFLNPRTLEKSATPYSLLPTPYSL